MRRFAWVFVAAAVAGCADIQRYVTGRQAAPLSERDYIAISFSRLVDPALKQAGRFRAVAVFLSAEDTVLDLPDDYTKGWIRVRMAEPGALANEFGNVVFPEARAKLVGELKKGEVVELFVQRVLVEDSWAFTEDGPKNMVLRVESMRRGAPKPDPNAARSFVNRRRADEYIRLLPGGRFQLRDRGRDLEGTYELAGDAVTFRLPSGKTAKATVKGDTLTDPDGKEWYQPRE